MERGSREEIEDLYGHLAALHADVSSQGGQEGACIISIIILYS